MPQNTKSQMTFWSKHDPVMMRRGKTDYWTKMKQSSTTMDIALPSGQVVAHSGYRTQKVPAKGEMIGTFQFNKNGTLTQIPDKSFNELIAKQLHGNLPGTYYRHDRSKSRSASAGPGNRTSLNTYYNEKAKTGFQYWPMDRPKPSKFGRYGIGSANTVLGLGNAVRT